MHLFCLMFSPFRCIWIAVLLPSSSQMTVFTKHTLTKLVKMFYIEHLQILSTWTSAGPLTPPLQGEADEVCTVKPKALSLSWYQGPSHLNAPHGKKKGQLVGQRVPLLPTLLLGFQRLCLSGEHSVLPLALPWQLGSFSDISDESSPASFLVHWGTVSLIQQGG